MKDLRIIGGNKMKCEKCGSKALVLITPYLKLCLSCGNEMTNEEELNKHIENVRGLTKKKRRQNS